MGSYKFQGKTVGFEMAGGRKLQCNKFVVYYQNEDRRASKKNKQNSDTLKIPFKRYNITFKVYEKIPLKV